MNKKQKEVQQVFLDAEKEVLEQLKKNYQDALDEINTKIAILMGRDDADMSHVMYQVVYQESLKKQVESALNTLQANEFETISDYLAKSYEDGYIGTMYDIQGQGIPIIMPMNQEQIVQAIQHETKLSEGLYKALGKDVKVLSKQIAGEITRGITGGQMYSEIARNIAGYAGISRNNAMRIARTEGHRIQCRATMDACEKAQTKGADVVKQWDASLDRRTRASHRRVDGQIRELDEPFSNGLMFPGDPDGGASEVINCRCALLQRARWALDESELETLKQRAEYFELDKAEDFADYKKKYLKASEKVADIEDLEKQFSDLTDGYSYDDFIDEFGSSKTTIDEIIEDGFEGASDEEIKKAKQIAEKIESLRGGSYIRKQPVNVIHTKQESIEILKTLGIDFADKSSGSISTEVLSKYTDFITNFESTHPGYFVENKLKLKSLTIVDEVKGHKYASGIYRTATNGIEIRKSSIESKQSSSMSKSDDFEMHYIAHEYGHYVADTLEKNFKITDSNIVQSAILRYYDGDIFKSPKDLKDILSSYGSTSYTEAFAEAFAEAYTSKEPREFARLFKEELENALEKTAKSSKIISKELADNEVKALNDYMSAKSYVVNEKLRNGTILGQDEIELVENLEKALDKMPDYEGNLQRSLYFYSDEDVKSFMNTYQVGSKIQYNEFLSTSKGKVYNPDGQVQIFIQDAKSGKDISALNSDEEEVLYKTDSSFRVLNVVEQDGKYFILVVEDYE